MKKSVKCTVLCLIMVCCMVFSLPLTASAAVREYTFNLCEPPMGDGQGYVLVELLNVNTGKYYLQCFFWNSIIVGSSNINAVDDSSMFITIKNDVISFAPIYQSEFSFACIFSYFLDYDNGLNNYIYREASSPMQTIYSFAFGSAYDVVSYQCYGDFISVVDDIENRINFDVAWGETKLVLDELSVLISQMQNSLANDDKEIQALKDILTNTNDIEKLCTDLVSWAQKNNLQLIDINSKLDEILEILNSSGESTFEEPSTESISDYNKAEDELVSGADDTSDIESQIEDFEIDPDSSSLIWGIIQGYLNQNELVFGLVVGVLCLGIIALILNR